MKKYLIGIVIGVCLAITAGSVYLMLSFTKQVNVNTQNVSRIVQFLNEAQTEPQPEAQPQE